MVSRSTALVLIPDVPKRKIGKGAGRGRVPADLTGQKFGKLTVIKLLGKTVYSGVFQRVWHCACVCGKTKAVIQRHLVRGVINSCGCMRKEQIISRNESRRLAPKECHKNFVYRHFKANAQKRKIPFELSRDDLIALVIKPCHYCGLQPFTRKNYQHPTQKQKPMFDEMIAYTGVDRIDSSKGYVPTNCVSCCPFCNAAKAARSLKEFTVWLDHLAKLRSLRL
jgi:hypothetical protein